MAGTSWRSRTGLIIGAVQRRYPGASFAALVGVGILCGALFNLLMWALTRNRIDS